MVCKVGQPLGNSLRVLYLRSRRWEYPLRLLDAAEIACPRRRCNSANLVSSVCRGVGGRGLHCKVAQGVLNS